MTFAIPALLAGLATLAAPLLIHWLFRPRARRLRFPATALLAAALASGRRAQRVRDLWLLLLRALLVAAAVLLLAGPVWPGAPSDVSPQGPAAAAIVIDDSASTLYELGPDRSLRDAIFDRAAALIDELSTRPPGTVATVVYAADADRSRPATDDFSSLRRELAAQRTRAADASTLRAAIRAAVQHLADARPQRKELLIVTDLAAHAWRDVEGAALRGMPDAQVRVVAPEAGQRTNLAVSIGNPSRKILSDLGSAPLNVALSSAGVGASATLVVREGARILERVGPLEIAADAVRTVTVALPRRSADACTLIAALEPADRLAFDQAAFVAWQTGPRPTAWFVRPARVPPQDATAELIWRNLLAPEALAESERPLAVQVFDGQGSVDRPAPSGGAPDLIVVMPGVDLNDPARRAIVSAVEGGAVLLLACGGGDTALDWPGLRRMLGDAPPVLERMSATQSLDWTPDADAAATLEPGVEELTRAPIRRRLAFEPAAGGVIEARFGDGKAAIVSRRIGKGVAVLLATSPDPAWSDLGLRAAGLLSWLNALAVRNRPESDRAANFTLGQRSQRVFAGLPDRGSVTVRPDGAAEGRRVALDAGQPVDGWPTRAAGLYEVVADNGRILARYAVNWPPDESDLRPITPERAAGILGVQAVSFEAPGGAAAAASGPAAAFFTGLADPHALLAIGLIVLVAGEALLSARRPAGPASGDAASEPG